ncbi:MAG: anti-sigma factor antagonist [Clostridia bacterium]|nr:anti-sigma factor antagonist [Clostridia bacterium]
MKWDFERKKNLLVAKIFGEVDHHFAGALREEIDRQVINSGAKGLILDFSGVDMMDSSGIGIIMGRCRLMESMGGHLCVTGANEPIRKIILLSGLGKLVGVCDSIEKAEKILNTTNEIA